MSDVKRSLLWKQRYTLTPGVATLLGVAFGGALAIVCAFNPPRDFSFSFLLTLLLCLGPFGGIVGFVIWLNAEPVREDRFLRITRLVAFPAILGLLLTLPDFWWHRGRFMGPIMVMMLMGLVCAGSMFAVGAGWGLVHLVGHLAISFRQSNKRGTGSRTDGVWDRELDQR